MPVSLLLWRRDQITGFKAQLELDVKSGHSSRLRLAVMFLRKNNRGSEVVNLLQLPLLFFKQLGGRLSFTLCNLI